MMLLQSWALNRQSRESDRRVRQGVNELLPRVFQISKFKEKEGRLEYVLNMHAAYI